MEERLEIGNRITIPSIREVYLDTSSRGYVGRIPIIGMTQEEVKDKLDDMFCTMRFNGRDVLALRFIISEVEEDSGSKPPPRFSTGPLMKGVPSMSLRKIELKDIKDLCSCLSCRQR